MVYHTPKYGRKASKPDSVKVEEKRHHKKKKKKKTVSKKVKKDKHKRKSPKDKKKYKKAAPEKKVPTPKKTIRNRMTLPDLDDMDAEPSSYVKGDLYKKSKTLNISSETQIVSSGDDDLKQMEHFVDLTTSCFEPTTSTPNDPHAVDNIPRRSPRTSTRTQKYDEKLETKGAKKILSFDANTKEYNPPEENKKTTANSSTHVPPPEEDVSLRVARLESLVCTMEMEKRENDKYRRESEYQKKEYDSKIATVLERTAADRKTLLDGFNKAMDNQTNIIRGE